MVFDHVPSLLACSCENDECDKVVVKASCGFKHDIVVVFKHTFVEEKYSL